MTTQDFFKVREKYYGAAIETQVVIFLTEAALGGALGAGAYDAVKLTLRAIAHRWGERQQDDEPPTPSRDEVDMLAHAAIRLRFDLDESVPLVTEELTQVDDNMWSGRIRNDDRGVGYTVRLGPEWDPAKVIVLFTW